MDELCNDDVSSDVKKMLQFEGIGWALVVLGKPPGASNWTLTLSLESARVKKRKKL